MDGRTVKAIAAAVAVAVVVAVSGVVPAGAHEPGPVPLECGMGPITTDVVLTGDLTCAEGFSATYGGVPAVSIDLRGHTLTVPGATCGTLGACQGLNWFAEVANGRIVGNISNARSVHHMQVEGRVWMSSSPGSGGPDRLTHSVVTGEVRHFGGEHGVIEANILAGGLVVANDLRGLDVTVTRNWIMSSPGAGIVARANLPSTVSGTVDHNIVWGSADVGIDVTGVLFQFGDLAVAANLVLGSGGDGIRVLQPPSPAPPWPQGGPITLAGNAALANGGHGINAVWPREPLPGEVGIVDGGGNRALFNALRPRCIGVACRW